MRTQLFNALWEASAGFACLAAALAWNRGRLAPSLIFTLAFGLPLGSSALLAELTMPLTLSCLRYS